MKKLKSRLYWIAVLVSYLLAFTLFGIIIAVVFGFPDSLIGGFASWSLIICFLLFGADDETREAVKVIIKKKPRPWRNQAKRNKAVSAAQESHPHDAPRICKTRTVERRSTVRVFDVCLLILPHSGNCRLGFTSRPRRRGRSERWTRRAPKRPNHAGAAFRSTLPWP